VNSKEYLNIDEMYSSDFLISAAMEGIYDGYYEAGNFSVKKVTKGCLNMRSFKVLGIRLMRSRHFWGVTLCLFNTVTEFSDDR